MTQPAQPWVTDSHSLMWSEESTHASSAPPPQATVSLLAPPALAERAIAPDAGRAPPALSA